MTKIKCNYCECELSSAYYKRHLKTKKHLKNVKFKEIEELEEYITCSICLEYIRDKRSCRETKCGHIYHRQCLNKWLRVGNTCPYCRAELKSRRRPQIFSINTEVLPLLQFNLFDDEPELMNETRFIISENSVSI